MFPESIRHYMIKGKLEKAREVLEKVAKYNRKPMIDDKLEHVEQEHKSSLKRFVFHPTYQEIHIIILFCMVGAQH